MASSKVILALDSGVLISATKNPKIEAVIRKWVGEGAGVVIPAPCVTESLRGSSGDAAANRIIKAVGTVLALNEDVARFAGTMLGRYRRRDTVDAMIVATALAHGATDIMTSDPTDIAALSGGTLNVIAI